MIRTESLTKYFGRRCAVSNFDVEIESHQIVGFLGLNGAGKTTTLRMLVGLLAPSSGRVLVDGEDLAGSHGERARARIGFLPDRPPVHEEMLVREYLDFAAKLRGHPGGSSRVGDVLERTALGDYADEPIAHLSHGYRQRVGIAQAIVHDPAFVVLDEPTTGLDPVQIVDMRSLIRSLREDHTVVLSSHNLNEVSETCDEIILINEGKLAAQGTPDGLSEKLGAGHGFELTLVGDKDAVTGALSRAEAGGLIKSYLVEASTDPGAHDATVTGQEAPEDIAQFLFSAGVGIRRLQPGRSDLEGLFAELTRRAS